MSDSSAMVSNASADHHKDLVRRIVDDMFNQGRLDVSPELFGPSFVDWGHEGTGPKRGGPEGWADFVGAVREALPDLNATIQNMVAEGDYVAMWNTATATHQRELFGISPSGKQIVLKDFHFFRFFDGKIVEHWNQVSVSPGE
jgi:predicted ester cyclase